MTWEDTIRDYMNRDENDSTEDDDNMTDTNERVIQQRSKSGTSEIRVQSLIGETVFEQCSVCRRSLPDDGERSELFHITAMESNTVNCTGVNTTSFCEHSVDSRAATQAKSTSRDLCDSNEQRSQCVPPHTIDVEVMVKSGGSTPRDAYIYYEIDTVFMHESEVERI